MIAIVLLGLLASAAAAPRFGHNGFGRQYFKDNMFDTSQFWAGLDQEMRQLDTEMRQLDSMLADFYKQFPSCVSQQGVEGNDYVIKITLSGFEGKDIVVKAREGLLMVQAVHKLEYGGESSYLDVKTLPANIDVKGTWTYTEGVLKIVFPLKEHASTEVSNTPDQTESPLPSSREEIEPYDDGNKDENADVLRGDQQKEVDTNEIPRNGVEATTYAVDLKGDVEFIPVNF